MGSDGCLTVTQRDVGPITVGPSMMWQMIRCRIGHHCARLVLERGSGWNASLRRILNIVGGEPNMMRNPITGGLDVIGFASYLCVMSGCTVATWGGDTQLVPSLPSSAPPIAGDMIVEFYYEKLLAEGFPEGIKRTGQREDMRLWS